ncbi:MAG TPA: hypothetical protein VMJ31_01435 [Methylocystis sp.]|nr:hypothetical protein [Methylocystis sp.]
MLWKRLSKWTDEELEKGLLRQSTPAREDRLLAEIKRRRKKEIEENIRKAERLETRLQRRRAMKKLSLSLGAVALAFCLAIGFAEYKGVDVYGYGIAAAQVAKHFYPTIEREATDAVGVVKSLLGE